MPKDEAQKVAEETIRRLAHIKPKWFTAHEKSDTKEFGAIRSTLKSQDGVLAEQKKVLADLVKVQDEYHKKSLEFMDSTKPVFEYLNEITVGRKIREDYVNATGAGIKILLGLSAIGGIVWAIFRFLVFNAR